MRIKNDDVLAHLRSFGFTMQENNAQGFIRWQRYACHHCERTV